MPGKKEMSFEAALGRLEEIVASMESGEASLSDLMQQYSEGVELSKFCMASLDRAEKAMDLLVGEKDGKVTEEPLVIEGE